MSAAPVLPRAERTLLAPAAIIALQLAAALYMVFDSVDDIFQHARDRFDTASVVEGLVAAVLLAGVVLGVRHIAAVTRELRAKEQSLARARGAVAAHIAVRFAAWGLTRGEADVALFALKGCDVAEIARLRGAAPGTVRSQLSQIYAKAGVTSQPMLLSLFLDDLIDLAR